MRQQMKMLPLSRLKSRHVATPREDANNDVHAPCVQHFSAFFSHPEARNVARQVMRLGDPDLCVTGEDRKVRVYPEDLDKKVG